MEFERACGVLLHPTSFPGRYGIGDLGEEAYRFVDFLAETGQTLWQLMPLGPTGYGDSPYASFSAFAGNPFLISPDLLLKDGLLKNEDLSIIPDFSSSKVEYGPVIDFKKHLLEQSFTRFEASAPESAKDEFEAFKEKNKNWLDDYALFMALKDHHNGALWNTWEKEIAEHNPNSIEAWRSKLARPVSFYSYLQFQFQRQWSALKKYANERSVKLIGDIPIFVAFDSVDLWANRSLFYLNPDGTPSFVAGVPPDFFSATGQLWGNPLYKWDQMEKQDYKWWVERFHRTLQMVDIVRIDHFRGFEAYWSVPAKEETAINGKWVKGPGEALFKMVKLKLGDIPIIAEDLGLITPEVAALRVALGLPGMKVLQFAFGDNATNAYLPHNYDHKAVVYSGNHDNDTTRGWFEKLGQEERTKVQEYLARDGSDINWDFIRLAFSSVADSVIIPLQDILGLGSEGRMNIPGEAAGNWTWRYWPDALEQSIKDRLSQITRLYARNPVEIRRIKAEEEARSSEVRA